VLADCVVTVAHGTDFVNPQLFVFLTKSGDEARQWCRELRRYSIQHYRAGVHDAFYYWRRLFARTRVQLLAGCDGEDEGGVGVESILDAVLPHAKQKEVRRLLEKVLLRTLPVLKDKKKATPKLLADEVFLLKLYKVVTQSRVDVEDLFMRRFPKGRWIGKESKNRKPIAPSCQLRNYSYSVPLFLQTSLTLTIISFPLGPKC